MRIPNNYVEISDCQLFENWLKQPETDKLLSEISYEIEVHYSLFFKDYPNDKMYAHPIVCLIFSYWREIYKSHGK
jgi:hypothetical protein